MNDIIVHALAERVKAGMMVIEEVPEVFRTEVKKLLESKVD